MPHLGKKKIVMLSIVMLIVNSQLSIAENDIVIFEISTLEFV